MRSVAITTANVHDGIMLEAVLPHEPGEVYADNADAADRFTEVIQARGGVPRVVHTHTWGGPAALARLEAWNAAVRAVRCRIEKVFGTWKRACAGCAGAGSPRRACKCASRPSPTISVARRRS